MKVGRKKLTGWPEDKQLPFVLEPVIFERVDYRWGSEACYKLVESRSHKSHL
jgi:hypothetical protein